MPRQRNNGDGARDVVRVCSIVNEGCSAANRIEPLLYLLKLAGLFHHLPAKATHPIAYVLQSDEGAIAVIGSNIVRAEM